MNTSNKDEEAAAVETILSIGAKSLNPDDYSELERILIRLCKTRSVKYKINKE